MQLSADGWFAATHERFTVKVWRPDKPWRRVMNLLSTKRISVRPCQVPDWVTVATCCSLHDTVDIRELLV